MLKTGDNKSRKFFLARSVASTILLLSSKNQKRK